MEAVGIFLVVCYLCIGVYVVHVAIDTRRK